MFEKFNEEIEILIGNRPKPKEYLRRRKNKRKSVFKRDNGICHRCHRDCKIIDERLKWLLENDDIYAVNDYLREMKLTGWSAWHAHHIIPLCENGSNNLDNLETLCQWCHEKHHKGKS